MQINWFGATGKRKQDEHNLCQEFREKMKFGTGISCWNDMVRSWELVMESLDGEAVIQESETSRLLQYENEMKGEIQFWGHTDTQPSFCPSRAAS